MTHIVVFNLLVDLCFLCVTYFYSRLCLGFIRVSNLQNSKTMLLQSALDCSKLGLILVTPSFRPTHNVIVSFLKLNSAIENTPF